MLSEKDLLEAKEIYLSEKDEILIPVQDKNIGYRFAKETCQWEVSKRWYSWKVYCPAITGKEALAIKKQWIAKKENEAHLLNTAIEFATKKHSGQVRKGTSVPYILHPLEVLQILYSMRADTNLMIAGVLHDTVEDTDTTLDEIKELFGEDVAELVAFNSEDKEKSWEERKAHTIDTLENADIRKKMLVLSDKLSNLRSIAIDYENLGDRLWNRFNAPKEKQAWYYSGVQDALYDMQDYPECETAYWEFVGLFKDVFVKFFIDKDSHTLYQFCITGEWYCLEYGTSRWTSPADDISKVLSEKAEKNDSSPYYYSCSFEKANLSPVSRKQAEFLEDTWTEIYKI